jgi:hypothetical protein
MRAEDEKNKRWEMIKHEDVDLILNEEEIDKLFGFDVLGLSWAVDKQGNLHLHVKGLRFEK